MGSAFQFSNISYKQDLPELYQAFKGILTTNLLSKDESQTPVSAFSNVRLQLPRTAISLKMEKQGSKYIAQRETYPWSEMLEVFGTSPNFI